MCCSECKKEISPLREILLLTVGIESYQSKLLKSIWIMIFLTTQKASAGWVILPQWDYHTHFFTHCTDIYNIQVVLAEYFEDGENIIIILNLPSKASRSIFISYLLVIVIVVRWEIFLMQEVIGLYFPSSLILITVYYYLHNWYGLLLFIWMVMYQKQEKKIPTDKNSFWNMGMFFIICLFFFP